MQNGDSNSDLPSVERLLAELESPNTFLAQEAQLSLQDHGARAIPAVLARLPRLGVFAQRCALDFLESCEVDAVRGVKDPTVAEVLIPFVEDVAADSVVREWSANVLGWIGATEAIPSLQRALARARAAGTPPHFTEPVRLRRALTLLGARHPVVPADVQRLARHEPVLGECWPATHLAGLIESLAAADQVLLYFQAWEKVGEDFYWRETPQYDLDFELAWPRLVAQAHDAALGAAREWEPPGEAVVTLEWVGAEDLGTGDAA
jgi:hypothetical protein